MNINISFIYRFKPPLHKPIWHIYTKKNNYRKCVHLRPPFLFDFQYDPSIDKCAPVLES